MKTDSVSFRTLVSLAALGAGVATLLGACGGTESPAGTTGPSTTTTSSASGSAASTSGAGGAGGTTTSAASSSTSGATSSTSSTSGTVGTGGSNAGTGGSTDGTGGGTAGTSGGAAGTGGSTGVGGRADAGSDAGGIAGSGGSGNFDAGSLPKFSFFVTSLKAIRQLGGQNGFGGDLRFGKADGLSGADEICRQIAETSMPGSGAKQWRAFLSIVMGPGGMPVHAIDRVGSGPWYDRRGRLLAMTKADLQQPRPRGADMVISDNLPNEDGVPNHNPDGTGDVDNHDVLTGSNTMGMVYSNNWSSTCHDWTSKVGSDGKPRVGHSWPRQGSGVHWISSLDEGGCGAGINVVEMGPPREATVGSGGGYGGIYCFALVP